MIPGGPLCEVGCGRIPDPGMFMCNHCWGLLTPQQRRRVWEAWTQVRDEIRGSREYFDTLKAEAVVIVQKELGVTPA